MEAQGKVFFSVFVFSILVSCGYGAHDVTYCNRQYQSLPDPINFEAESISQLKDSRNGCLCYLCYKPGIRLLRPKMAMTCYTNSSHEQFPPEPYPKRI